LEDAQPVKDRLKFLIITATDVETDALHALFRPLPTFNRCLRVAVGNQVYFLGKLGGYAVVHVQCRMGSISPGASKGTVTDAINLWDSRAVVMVGIGYGVDRKKQRVGDVLVSKTVIPYEIKREGVKPIQRNSIPPAGATLLNRFSSSQGWSYSLPKDHLARVLPTDMLSGESLIDNEKFRRRLLKTFPQAEGGEMEGAGVFSSAHEKGIQWILVKSICDFADGKKSRNKKANQRIAAASSASFCSHVFSHEGNFDELSLPASDGSCKVSCGLTAEEILFEVYEPAFENAYLGRKEDEDIDGHLKHQGIWVHGPTGCGKTNALRRNLLAGGKTFHSVDLSCCVGSSVPQVFGALHMEIAQRLGVGMEPAPEAMKGSELAFHVRGIAKIIEHHVKERTFIFIDEIPLSGSDFKRFFEGVLAVIITLTNRNFRKAPLVLSSIPDPMAHITEINRKVQGQIRLMPLAKWSSADITSLVGHLLKLLRIKLTAGDRAKIVNAANGSPRSVKAVLRTRWNHPDWPLDRIISECPEF
jgi:nucleoside phosphorylase